MVLTNWVDLESSLRINKRLTIRSNGDPYFTWIRGDFEGQLIQIAAEGIVFEALRLIGSPRTDGLLVAKDLILRDCTIQSCRQPIASELGLYSEVRVRLERVTVSDNREGFECHNLEAKDSTFSFSMGTGAFARNADLDGCVFESNRGAIETDAQPVADTDSDGVPDIWERFRRLNPFDPADATSDTDADGQNALVEFHSRTDPSDPQSVHRLAQFQLVPAPALQPYPRFAYLIWSRYPGAVYEVEISTNRREWRKAPGELSRFGLQNGRQMLGYEVRADSAMSFYRVSVRGDKAFE